MILPIKSTLIDQKIAALGFLVLLFWLIQEMLVNQQPVLMVIMRQMPSEFACLRKLASSNSFPSIKSEQLRFYKKNNSFGL